MKKSSLLLMCFSMLLGFTSCNNNSNSSSVGSENSNNSINSELSNEESSDKQESTDNNVSSDDKLTIEEKENRELYVCIPEGRDLKVAQFADIHFGDGTGTPGRGVC